MKSPPIWTVTENKGNVNMLRLAMKAVLITMIICMKSASVCYYERVKPLLAVQQNLLPKPEM